MTGRAGLIEVRGARTHNLRDIDVDIPVEACTVVVGPSGSGKSSLAFGTVHSAAHSAYMEGISSYARFAETRLPTPDVDTIRGLRPTLALAQGYGGRSSRSTVGTVTDALALLRLLFSRLGQPERSAGQLSFLNPEAVCDVCRGAGATLAPVVSRLIDSRLTLSEGAIRHRGWKVGGRYSNIMAATGRVPMDRPVATFTKEQWKFLLHSASFEVNNQNPGFVQRFTYEGLVPRLMKRVGDARDLDSRSYDLTFFDRQPCTACEGTRLSTGAQNVRIGKTRFADALTAELVDLRQLVADIDHPVVHAIQRRLGTILDRMTDMGLGHLTVLRPTTTLSGGELRRVRIAHQLTSPLTGLVYVVDEASAGLHHEEGLAVYESLRHLVDIGSTVILVDHSDGALGVSDYVIEMGPGGGRRGGRVVWAGPRQQYTGHYGRLPSIERRPGRSVDGQGFVIEARSNNLRAAEVVIPRNCFVVLAGPSGSGKSSLAVDIAAQVPNAAFLSQRDIGGSVRSVIATYLKVFDHLRKMFAMEAGRPAGDFSFNGSGACRACGGWGYVRVEMQFLESVETACEECGGRRYRQELLTTVVRGLSIADVLDLTVDEALATFGDDAAVQRPLKVASAVGIGHLVLGQSTDTLSGGEAQRIRISTEVSTPQRDIFLLDEPTRGLGYDEVPRFISLVDDLLRRRKTVVAIEHNLSVAAASDWIIELGPGSGSQGGRVVASGTPDDLRAGATLTGRALKRLTAAAL
jgi:excinuclease UvrABC ATPase subunit